MLSPFSVTGCFVVDSGQKLKVLDGYLRRFDAKFVIELSLCCSLDSHNSFIQLRTTFTGYAKRMGAAGISPHIREGDLFGRTLLKEQFIL